jgi:hypothetical protein
VLGKDEETKARPNGITQKEEVQIEKPQDLSSGAAQVAKVQIEKP